MVSSNQMKLLSKTMQGGDDYNEVNESEEFDSKHYFVGRVCFTGVSGRCMIPSLAHSASNLICPGYLFPFFVSLGISNIVLAYSQYKLPVRGMETPETGTKHFQFYINNLPSEQATNLDAW